MGKYGSSIGLREILNAGSNEQLAIGTQDPYAGRKQTKGTILLPSRTRAGMCARYQLHAQGRAVSSPTLFARIFSTALVYASLIHAPN